MNLHAMSAIRQREFRAFRIRDDDGFCQQCAIQRNIQAAMHMKVAAGEFLRLIQFDAPVIPFSL